VPRYRRADILSRLTKSANSKKDAPIAFNFANLLGRRNELIKTIGRPLLVALSLASAHYFGFMSSVPFEIASVVTIDFLPAFITTFSFYFLLCYTISSVVAFIVSQVFFSAGHTLAAFSLQPRKRWPTRFAQTSIKLFKESIKYEVPAYYLVLAITFLLLFNISYLELLYTRVGITTWIYLLIALIAMALKVGFLARPPAVVISRLRDKKRVAYRRQAARSAIYFATAIALAFSYYAGLLRFDKLKNEQPVSIESEHFIGSANILLKSGSSHLTLLRDEEKIEYVYFNQNLSIRHVIKRNMKVEGQAED